MLSEVLNRQVNATMRPRFHLTALNAEVDGGFAPARQSAEDYLRKKDLL
ncbi:MAG: hypothetical protein JWR90_1995 [Marmoricola sp.]|jgi:hypothetical protein|nr:hypothetical protein [Marmoricola sp.]